LTDFFFLFSGILTKHFFSRKTGEVLPYQPALMDLFLARFFFHFKTLLCAAAYLPSLRMLPLLASLFFLHCKDLPKGRFLQRPRLLESLLLFILSPPFIQKKDLRVKSISYAPFCFFFTTL